MRDRQLLRTKTYSASVAGVVSKTDHEEIESILTAADGGGIDPSGLAFIVTDNRIRIWKQDIFSLSEEIMSDLASVVELQHQAPLQDSYDGSESSTASRRVVLLPSLSGMNYANSQRKTESIYSGMSLYWASPCGTICYWNDLSESQRDCDVSTSLPLQEQEFVTFVTRHEASGSGVGMGNAGSILVGTSRKRTFHVWKNSRPLELQARLLFVSNLSAADIGGSRTGTAAGGSMLSSVYSYMFTPGKPKRSAGTRVPSNDDQMDEASDGRKPSIVGIFNFSVATQMQLFSPTKRSKRSHPNVGRDPSKSQIYTIADDGRIDEWHCAFNASEGWYDGAHSSRTNVSSSLNMSVGESLKNITVLHADMDMGAESASIVVCVRASVTSEESGISSNRFYLVHLPIDSQTGHIQSGSSIWLSRYANHAITYTPNPLVCVGLITAIEDVDGDSSTVAYCAFHQKKAGGHLPVTVSAVRFAAGGSSIVDIDMPDDVSPHAVAGALQHDSATDGCNMMCSTGLIMNVRATFPAIPIAASSNRSRSIEFVDKGMLDILVGHLYSAFQTHRRKNESQQFQLPMSPRGNSPYAKKADSIFLPPSISHADGDILSLATVAVSAQLVDESVPSKSDSMGELSIVEGKVKMHQNFIKYLIHVGVYKRVNLKGRLALRDHGEMMYAIGGLLSNWNMILEGETRGESMYGASDAAGENHREEMVLFGNLLKGLTAKVTQFPGNFLRFQQELLSTLSENDIPTSNWVVFALLSVHCEAIQIALTYRSDHSEKLYDISDLDGISMYHDNGIEPWTSSKSGLSNCEHSLQALAAVITSSEERSQVFQEMQEKIGEFVQCLATTWLDGYQGISPSSRNEGDYDKAKSLSYDLLTSFCPPGEENEDDIAFSLSLSNAYFFGVVELCRTYANHGKYDPKYDLISLVSDPIESLAQAVDYKTGLSFQKYVLCWHTERNMFGTVLQLGKCCPVILSEYIEEDERLAHVRWIQHVKSNQYTKAASGLISLSSDGISAFGEKAGHQSLEGRQLVMSLAKLGALASTDNSLQSKHVQTIAQEHLDLCTAQEILEDMVDSHNVTHHAMDANELMNLAMNIAHSTKDRDDKFRACITGLSIAKAMATDGSINSSSRKSHVAKAWAVAIDADAETWSKLVDEWDLLSDKDKESSIERTVFFNVASKYYSDRNVQKNDEVGFTTVQNEVIRFLALEKDGLSDLLMTVLSLCGVSAQ